MLIYVDNDGPNVVSAAVLVLVVFRGSSQDWQLGSFRHTLGNFWRPAAGRRNSIWYRDSDGVIYLLVSVGVGNEVRQQTVSCFLVCPPAHTTTTKGARFAERHTRQHRI